MRTVEHWTIEPLTSADEIDAILAIEQASFTNPVDARDVPRRAGERRRVVLLPGARRGSAASSASARSGGCSTSCTSTTWRWCRSSGGWGSRPALLRRVLDEGARLGARRATLEVRQSNDAARQLYERFGFTVAGRRSELLHQPDRGRPGAVARRAGVTTLKRPGPCVTFRRTTSGIHAAAHPEPTIWTPYKGGGA